MPYYPPPPPPTAQPPPPPPAIPPPYPAAAPPPDGFPQPSYHDTRPSEQPARGVVARGNQLAKNVTRKVIDASKADGADESGLTALIWNQVLSYGTDAMITVALAGTVFFGASPHAQRGNVLLYLLVTMAPFAIVAPVIGPALDRLQHGRRYAMAATAIGRAVLALVMAAHPTDLLVLYPCALGSLVLSKAYSVIRAAAAPRLVPAGMTLVEANARLSIFGLGSALIGGGVVAAVIKVSGSYTAGLVVTAVAFGVCAFFAFRLPKHIDSVAPAPRHPQEPARQAVTQPTPQVARLQRLQAWAKRGFEAQVVTSLQGESTLRFLSGLLTIYLAFYVESTWRGWTAAFALGAVVVAAGAGNFAGTAIGTRLKLAHPEALILIGCGAAAACCLLVALLFSITLAVLGMFVSAVTNSISKISLDAVIQRDVIETLRSSAFGRSETFLQLAWVLGATIGVLLPSDNGPLGFWVAGGVVGLVSVVLLLRNRALRRAASRGGRSVAPGGLPAQPAPDPHHP